MDAHLLPWKNVSSRQMFGAMVYLGNSKMFAFVYDNRVIVKLRKEDKPEAEEHWGARPFIHVHTGRFGDWMEFSQASPSEVAGAVNWISKSYEYVQTAAAEGVASTGRRRRRLY